MRLTIAIPTYNRPAQLRATLEVVLPQVLASPEADLLVLDNHSQTPAETVLRALLPEPHPRVQVVRHPVNIGGNANIMRCFERCTADWLWVLGDDDLPAADAVATILRDAAGSHQYAYYHVPRIRRPAFRPAEPETVEGCRFEELLEYFRGGYQQLLFLSAAVFRMEAFRAHVLAGYLNVNTGMPHMAMLIEVLRDGGSWKLSRRSIVDYEVPPMGERWAVLSLLYALPTLLGSGTDAAGTRLLCRIVAREFPGPLSPQLLLYHVIEHHQLLRSGPELPYLWNLLRRLYAPPLSAHPIRWLLWQGCALAARFPRVYRGLVYRYVSCTGKLLPGVNLSRR